MFKCQYCGELLNTLPQGVVIGCTCVESQQADRAERARKQQWMNEKSAHIRNQKLRRK